MHEAKSNLSRLVEAVEEGSEREVVIARNGKPVAKLVPLGARQRRPIGLYDGVYPDISLAAFNAADGEIATLMIDGSPLADKRPGDKPERKPRRRMG